MTETERLLWKLVDRLRDAPPEVLEGVVSRLAAVIDGQTEKPITRLLVGEYSKRLPRMMEMFRDLPAHTAAVDGEPCFIGADRDAKCAP
jgi:hypothetical protein